MKYVFVILLGILEVVAITAAVASFTIAALQYADGIPPGNALLETIVELLFALYMNKLRCQTMAKQ